MSSDIEKFNNYKYYFDMFQRYFEADYSCNKSFVKDYENIREKFLIFKPYYEKLTKDYRKNSSYIKIGKTSYEFITPNKFKEIKRKTNITDIERKIINLSYIGSSFSWHLNSKLRNGQNLKGE